MELFKVVVLFLVRYKLLLIYVAFIGCFLALFNTIYISYKGIVTKKELNGITDLNKKEEKIMSFLNFYNSAFRKYKYFLFMCFLPLLFFGILITTGIIVKGKLIFDLRISILTYIGILIILFLFFFTSTVFKKEDIKKILKIQ